MVVKTVKKKMKCNHDSLVVSIEKGENGLRVLGVCSQCGHTEFEGEYVVECPCCGDTCVPEVDEGGTFYPCCGNELPDIPPLEKLIPVEKSKELSLKELNGREVEWTAKPIDEAHGYVIEINGEPLFFTKENVAEKRVGDVIRGADAENGILKLEVSHIETYKDPDSIFRLGAKGKGIAYIEPMKNALDRLKQRIKNFRQQKEEKMAEVKAIVTHTRPGHTDDIIAVALLSQKYPNAEIRFVHPQSPELEELREREDVILVDVGGDYNPQKKNYDHHQDIDGLPFSLALVLRDEFPEYWEVITKNPLLKQSLDVLDFKDRFGVVKAEEITGVNPISALFLENFVVKPQGDTPEKLRALGKSIKEEFERQLELMRKLEAVRVEKIDGLTVAVDKNGLPVNLILSEYGQNSIDLIIQKNNRNPEHTSVIRNSTGTKVKEIEPARLKESAVYVHPNGFLAVLPEPVEKVAERLEEIVSKIHVKKKPSVENTQRQEESRGRSR